MRDERKITNSKRGGNDTDMIALTDGSICDFDSETIIIGYMLRGGNKAIDEIAHYLTDLSFIHPTNRQLYRAIAAVYNRGDDARDPFLLAQELRKAHTPLTEADVLDIVTDPRVVHAWCSDNMFVRARHLQELEQRRKYANIGLALAALAEDEEMPITDIHSRLRDLVADAPVEAAYTTLATAGDRLLSMVVDNLKGDTPAIGTPTGFARLDAVGGLHSGDLIVIAGDTSNGKTSLALTITLNAIKHERRVAYYSLEMSDHELVARLLAMESGVPASRLLYSRLGNSDGHDEYARAYDTFLALKRHSLFFDDRATSDFDSILTSIRAMVKNEHICGAVVDYIQILNVNNKGKLTQEQLMATVARQLKNLAKELDIWIIVLSQLNRNSQTPEPVLARLRDSGQIAEAADVVLFVYRPELYGRQYGEPFTGSSTAGTAQIEVAKGRNIGLMKFLVRFDAALTRFYEGDVPAAADPAAPTADTDPTTQQSNESGGIPF